MKSKKIFLVEDDPDDRFLTEAVLEELNVTTNIRFINHSNELFQLLSENDLPSLILVDFNSRPENGLTVLQKLKGDQSLKNIPVVILTDSSSPTYINQCYQSGASTVIKKPDSYEGSKNKIGLFIRYWLDVAEL